MFAPCPFSCGACHAGSPAFGHVLPPGHLLSAAAGGGNTKEETMRNIVETE
jgi:hypothetical protein